MVQLSILYRDSEHHNAMAKITETDRDDTIKPRADHTV